MLPEKPKQEITCTIRHIDDFFDTSTKLVVTAQKVGLVREVFVNRFLHAGVQELGVRSGVIEPVVVGALVQHLDVTVGGGLPPDQGQHAVGQITVNTAVSILKRMNIYEAEGQHGSGDYRIQLLRRPAVERDHARDQ